MTTDNLRVELPDGMTATVRVGTPVGDDGTIITANALRAPRVAVDDAQVGLFYDPALVEISEPPPVVSDIPLFGYGAAGEDVSLARGTVLYWPSGGHAGQLFRDVRVEGWPIPHGESRSCVTLALGGRRSETWHLCFENDAIRL